MTPPAKKPCQSPGRQAVSGIVSGSMLTANTVAEVQCVAVKTWKNVYSA